MTHAPEDPTPETGRRRLNVVGAAELLSVQKPAQYIGGETNSVIKNEADIDVRFALGFPDTYEVGMSHIGLQLIYEIINRDEKAWAERVFMPMADMEMLLRKKNAFLTSLESKRVLSEFDYLGFSLQYELCTTNILSMLELGGVPIFAEERSDEHPIVMGGGPWTYHPEPLAPFFDAFFLGDAEEAIPEMLEAAREAKKGGKVGYRARLLDLLENIDGMYLPRSFVPKYKEDGTLASIEAKNPNKNFVVKRLLKTLEDAPYAEKPIVPNIKTIHNRLSIEVMRGCVRGCRFCQAGYLYRPQRERRPDEIMRMVETALPASGYEELSLLSLSTADYCSIVPLLKQLMDVYGEGETLSISFPSTRVDSLTTEVLEQVQRVRRTNFTIAPEAGTQRLRDVINKGVSDEQILETCGNVFRMGWTGIKLYFMLGLPTETDEDLQGIIDTAGRIKALPEAKGKDVTVSVSTLVPKPHTPFQWSEQISQKETIRKQRFLADGVRKVGANFRYHDSFSSFLEGVFARGDRNLAKVIHRAYELGCRLDAWQEHLDEDKWMQAFADTNVNPHWYLRERDLLEPLPWDHLSASISKAYFAKEYQRALKDKESPDCLTKSCTICGACDYDEKKNVLWPRWEAEETFCQKEGAPRKARVASFDKDPVQRFRLGYAKSGPFRFVGHLELSQAFQRAARRAAIPLAFTKGFHPMPRLSFGPPIALGIESRHEFVDAFLVEKMEPEVLIEYFNQSLPPGIEIVEANEVPLREESIQNSIVEQRYRVTWISEPQGTVAEVISNDSLEKLTDFTIERERNTKAKGRARRRAKAKSLRLGDFISNVEVSNEHFLFSLRSMKEGGAPRPIELVQAVSDLKIGDFEIEKVETIFGKLLS
jgi:radical SAM family uncharacterized protein/radical SAM-linked protein